MITLGQALRLGDGEAGKATVLGGDFVLGSDEFSLGAKGGLFLGLRHARHEQDLLAPSAPAARAPSTFVPPDPGGGEGPGGDGGGGDGGGDGGDGGG